MSHQRIHKATSVTVSKLKESINKQREEEGLKKLSSPDIIGEAVEILYTQHLKALKEQGE